MRSALRIAQAGDTIVVYRLDQLGDKLRQRFIAVDTILAKQCAFTSLSDPDAAARLAHEVNYAPFPTTETPILGTVQFRLGTLLQAYARQLG